MESRDTVSYRRAIIAVGVALALALLVITKIAWHVRQEVANRYLERGDIYLTQLEFSAAVDEYQKALHADPSNAEAISRLHTAEIAPVDIAQAASFYQEHRVESVISKLQEAQQPYSTVTAAVAEGVKLYSAQEAVYAQYPLERAVQLDPGYPEAWNYLGLTYQELAKIDSTYTKKAEVAFARRDALTPAYRLKSATP